jgi:hypothetical protein
LRPHGAASCRYATRPVLRTNALRVGARPGHPTILCGRRAATAIGEEGTILGIKVSDGPVEAKIHGIDVAAHIKALPQAAGSQD